jgi:multidrug efflux pump
MPIGRAAVEDLLVAWFRIDPPAETNVSEQTSEAAPVLKGAAAE